MSAISIIIKKMETLDGVNKVEAEDIIKEAKSIALSNLIPTIDMGFDFNIYI